MFPGVEEEEKIYNDLHWFCFGLVLMKNEW
jgi:hypothetical protein